MWLRTSTVPHAAAIESPTAASPSTVPTATKFNDVVQADVMWIKVNDQKIPILHVIDLASSKF
jgi:hypothetical protein